MRFKSGAYTQYVSSLNRIATQPLDVRCIFETASKQNIRLVDVISRQTCNRGSKACPPLEDSLFQSRVGLRADHIPAGTESGRRFIPARKGMKSEPKNRRTEEYRMSKGGIAALGLFYKRDSMTQIPNLFFPFF